jgi:hypothetical protein
MKNLVFKLLFAVVVIIMILSSCNGVRQTEGAQHHRGVNNSGFRGY